MSIKELLTEKLSISNTDVKTKIVEKLYQDEVQKRTDACIVVMEKIKTVNAEVEKLSKGDIKTFDEHGTPHPPVFSEENIKALRKAKDTSERLISALDNAINENDFKKVLELGKQ